MNKHLFVRMVLFTLVASLFLTGCQPPQPASLSDNEVVQAVDSTLKAINAGNYPGFTEGFSEAMKSAFTEQQFTNLADLLKKSSGNYVSCADSQPELSNNKGYAVYRLPCKYDLESVLVTVTFKVDGNKIEGLFFDSTNLRKVSQ